MIATSRKPQKRKQLEAMGVTAALDATADDFLDDVREAGKLDGLSRLLNQGRTKGACVVLGFQDSDGMRDVYGEYVANELVGQCANKAILRVENPNNYP